MAKVMLRLTVPEDSNIQELVTAWLHDEGITVKTGGQTFSADINYVKELD